MKPTIYTVHAFRFGNREAHSYIVGVYSKKQKALNASEVEREYRGGKYVCQVIEWTLDSGRAGAAEATYKIIKPLPD